MAVQTMIWVFFWGVVTGVGIAFVGALFGVAIYLATRDAIKQQDEKNEEG
jgi:small basic protein